MRIPIQRVLKPMLILALVFCASCGGGGASSGPPPPPPPPTPPPAPSLSAPTTGTSLTAGTTSVVLQWTSVSSATAYDVEATTGSCGGTMFATNSTAATSVNLGSLTNGQTYFWHVRSIGAGGTSSYSGCFTFSVAGTPPPPGSTVQLTLQPQTFQAWEAWRGLLSGPNFMDNLRVDRNAPVAVINSALDDLANDLGINGVRYNLHFMQHIELTNDNSDPFVINWSGFDFARSFVPDANFASVDPVERMKQMILPLRQRVLARGEPFSLYVTLGYSKTGFGGMPAFWLSDPREYAEMAQACIEWMQNKSPSPPGFSVPSTFAPDYWTIVNEPDGTAGFVAADIAALIPAVGSRFASMGINTKIQTTETVFANATFLNNVLTAPNVSQYVGLVSFHGYDYSANPKPSTFAARNDARTKAQALSTALGRTIHTGMTEICCHSGWNGSYFNALGLARDIYWNMTEGDVSIWEAFGLLNACTTLGCTGSSNETPLALDADLSKTIKLPVYYGMRQYSHFIRPNDVRVGMTCTMNCPLPDPALGAVVKPVAFRSPGGKIVVVVINDQTAAQSISLLGLPAGTYDITGVDPGNAQSPVTYPVQAILAGQALTVTFPAQSILTFAQR